MVRSPFALGGTLLVAAALVFLTPGPSQAGRGGFHGGGFHGGGFHGGGFHPGGFRVGGFRGGYYGYFPFYRGYYGSYPYYGGYGSYPSYGGYGSYPSYGGYSPSWGASPSYYSNFASGPVYAPGYSTYAYQPAQTYSGAATPAGSTAGSDQSSLVSTSPVPADSSASVTVTVPADARLWFENTPTNLTGEVRQFNSPPLTPGTRYVYDVKASWYENGKKVTQTQTVEVTAGAHVDVDFPVPPRTAVHTSAVSHD
jgi:uncharacterized protein (TIGR03000 family)